ncbi:MAG TPA: HAMP domain-containing sensor histidine kinase [Drouetiella sp.]|jgi:signal transduction histidine kinase
MRLKLVHKGLLYLGVPLIIQAGFFLALSNLIARTEKSVERQTVHINIAHEMNFIIVHFCRVLVACGNGGGKGTVPVAQYRKLMDAHMAKLEEGIKSTSEDYQNVFNSSKKLIAAQYKLMELLQNENPDEPGSEFKQLVATRDVMHYAETTAPIIYNAWLKEEELLEQERLVDQKDRETIKQLVFWCSIFDFALAVILIAYFIKNITRRINLLVENARVLPTSRTLPNQVAGNDEIAFLDRAMHEAASELVKSSDYKRSLLEMIAHDLRNPLMAIGVAFEVMLKSAQDGHVTARDSRVRALRQTLQQITNLLESLLSLDRVEANELQLQLELVSADELIQDSYSLVHVQAEAKRVNLQLECGDNLFVIADRSRLLQVLSNLLGNAIKFAPEGSSVKLSAFAGDGTANTFFQPSSTVVFSVADKGPGIDASLHSQLFDKYFQVNAKDSGFPSFGAGFGLGLAISKQIIDKHAGKMGLCSEVGKGAVFWFSLALDRDDEGEAMEALS